MNLESQIWTWTRECVFSSSMETAHGLIREVMDRVRCEQWNNKDCFALELVLEEALTNAVKHGNLSDSSKSVRFDCRLNDRTIYVRVEDEGRGFDPLALADPRAPENQTVISGRGVLLIMHFASQVEWNERGNVVEFVKERG